jgi:hypothetical protein
MINDELVATYVAKIQPILSLAKKAYGSRDTKSPQHDASRRYTQLLVEFYSKGGSLLAISKALGVTYAGTRRRVITAELPTPSKKVRSKATPEDISAAVERIQVAKTYSTEQYHEALRHEYEDNGISLTKIAKVMGLSSANPLYYGVARTKIRANEVL